MLAAMSISELHGSGHEIADLLEATSEEAGMPYLPPGSRVGQEMAVQVMALRALSGDISPKALSTWAHRTFGHNLPIAEPLADLDHVYETLPSTDLAPDEIDADVLAAASAMFVRSAAGIAATRLCRWVTD
jgi:hypothetical protein